MPISLCAPTCVSLWRPESIGSIGIRIPGGGKASNCGCPEPNLGPFRDQYVILALSHCSSSAAVMLRKQFNGSF